MPARLLICPNCGWRQDTFLTDEEIVDYEIVCPRCGCPISAASIKTKS